MKSKKKSREKSCSPCGGEGGGDWSWCDDEEGWFFGIGTWGDLSIGDGEGRQSYPISLKYSFNLKKW